MFIIGDKVEVVRGKYAFTKIGSRGSVINVDENRNRVWVTFDKLTCDDGHKLQGTIFIMPIVSIELIDKSFRTNYLGCRRLLRPVWREHEKENKITKTNISKKQK